MKVKNEKAFYLIKVSFKHYNVFTEKARPCRVSSPMPIYNYYTARFISECDFYGHFHTN